MRKMKKTAKITKRATNRITKFEVPENTFGVLLEKDSDTGSIVKVYIDSLTGGSWEIDMTLRQVKVLPESIAEREFESGEFIGGAYRYCKDVYDILVMTMDALTLNRLLFPEDFPPELSNSVI